MSELVVGKVPAEPSLRRFLCVALATIVVIYLLILVGGIVRATGAGMGCPDWPTCFGRWVPPTSESELPANYQQIYADRGYRDTAFNVTKTWTEYLNRLLGVFTGLMILATLILSFPFRNGDKRVFQLALLGFVLVGFQGWLGSRVVASNLHPVMITVHMLVAQLIVAILIYAMARSQRHVLSREPIHTLPTWFGKLLWVTIAVSLLQLVIGTQVREAVDLIAHASDNTDRHLWIENLPVVFAVHRYIAWPIALLNAYLIYCIYSHVSTSGYLRNCATGLAVVFSATIVMGMSMQQMNLPVFAQPLHLWFASLIFGVQFFMYIVWRFASDRTVQTDQRPVTAGMQHDS